MKKLILGIGLSLLVLSFKLHIANNAVKNVDPKNLVTTLNGFSYAQANAMTYFSQGTTDNTPKKTQILFSRQIVDAWYNLLYAERQQTIGLSKKPDGIRIYIARTLPTATNPVHQNNGVIVVSTFSKDTVIHGEQTKMHKDYYNHPDTASLFRIAPNTGEITHDSNSRNGALLYSTCNCNTQICDANDPHEILRSDAEKMVQHFRYIPIIRNGSINSKAEWFGFDLIKKLHDDLNTSGDGGIRIYFARGIAKSDTVHRVRFVIALTKNKVDDFTCYHTAFVQVSEDNGELCQPNCQGVTLPQN